MTYNNMPEVQFRDAVAAATDADVAEARDYWQRRAELLGFATHARPGADGFDYHHADTHGCVLCALVAFRQAHPRRRKAWAVYIEATGARRMFSRKVALS